MTYALLLLLAACEAARPAPPGTRCRSESNDAAAQGNVRMTGTAPEPASELQSGSRVSCGRRRPRRWWRSKAISQAKLLADPGSAGRQIAETGCRGGQWASTPVTIAEGERGENETGLITRAPRAFRLSLSVAGRCQVLQGGRSAGGLPGEGRPRPASPALPCVSPETPVLSPAAPFRLGRVGADAKYPASRDRRVDLCAPESR